MQYAFLSSFKHEGFYVLIWDLKLQKVWQQFPAEVSEFHIFIQCSVLGRWLTVGGSDSSERRAGLAETCCPGWIYMVLKIIHYNRTKLTG